MHLLILIICFYLASAVTMQCDSEPEKNLIKISNIVKRIKDDYPGVKIIVFGEIITEWYFNFARALVHAYE